MGDSKASGAGVPVVIHSIGTNDADNIADSSLIVANPNGSMYERLEYIQQNLSASPEEKYTKVITSAANAGQVDVGTISGGPVIVNSVIVESNGATTSDLNFLSRLLLSINKININKLTINCLKT